MSKTLRKIDENFSGFTGGVVIICQGQVIGGIGVSGRKGKMTEAEEIKQSFKLVCKKCGSEDVVIDVEKGVDYGGETGYSSGYISLGCNACKQNDVCISI